MTHCIWPSLGTSKSSVGNEDRGACDSSERWLEEARMREWREEEGKRQGSMKSHCDCLCGWQRHGLQGCGTPRISLQSTRGLIDLPVWKEWLGHLHLLQPPKVAGDSWRVLILLHFPAVFRSELDGFLYFRECPKTESKNITWCAWQVPHLSEVHLSSTWNCLKIGPQGYDVRYQRHLPHHML